MLFKLCFALGPLMLLFAADRVRGRFAEVKSCECAICTQRRVSVAFHGAATPAEHDNLLNNCIR